MLLAIDNGVRYVLSGETSGYCHPCFFHVQNAFTGDAW